MQTAIYIHALDDSDPTFANNYPSLDAARRAIESQGYHIEDIEYRFEVGSIKIEIQHGDHDQPALPVPVIPDLDGQILKLLTTFENRLDMTEWHNGADDVSCSTTHCRGGWAIFLAGEAGRALEARYGSEGAALLLYDQAYPALPLPDFFCRETIALADMRARAGVPDDTN